jgi:hypothetical protein
LSSAAAARPWCWRALAHNAGAGGGRGKLISLEADPIWAAALRRLLSDDLAAFAEVLDVPAVPSQHAETNVWLFGELPPVVHDLVYVDGPAPSPDRNVAADVLDLEPALSVGCRVVVDGRTKNSEFLARHSRRRWERSYDRFLKRTVFRLAG